MQFFQMEKITHSGAKVLVRDIQMQFVELKALRMQSSTQSLLKVLWKELDQVKILNLQQEKNMKENVLLY